MSYDIWAECEHCKSDVTGSSGWNYTSNCAAMWRKAGIDFREFDGKPVETVLAPLAKAIEELCAHPEAYIPMNPKNGWGSYATLVPRLEELLTILRHVAHKNPQARLVVSS